MALRVVRELLTVRDVASERCGWNNAESLAEIVVALRSEPQLVRALFDHGLGLTE